MNNSSRWGKLNSLSSPSHVFRFLTSIANNIINPTRSVLRACEPKELLSQLLTFELHVLLIKFNSKQVFDDSGLQ